MFSDVYADPEALERVARHRAEIAEQARTLRAQYAEEGNPRARLARAQGNHVLGAVLDENPLYPTYRPAVEHLVTNRRLRRLVERRFAHIPLEQLEAACMLIDEVGPRRARLAAMAMAQRFQAPNLARVCFVLTAVFLADMLSPPDAAVVTVVAAMMLRAASTASTAMSARSGAPPGTEGCYEVREAVRSLVAAPGAPSFAA